MKRYFLLFTVFIYSTFSYSNVIISRGDVSHFNGEVYSSQDAAYKALVGRQFVHSGPYSCYTIYAAHSSTIYVRGHQKDGHVPACYTPFSNDYLAFRLVFSPYQCPSGTSLNTSTNKCEEEKICESDLNLGQVSWDRTIYGMRPSFCAAGCSSSPTNIVCTDESCSATAITIGQKCEQGQDDGIYPTDPTEPEEPTDPTNPVDPVDPTNPTEPTDPTNPTEPTEPTQPEPLPDPTNPVPENPPFQGGAGGNPPPPIDVVVPPSIPSEPPYQGNDEGIILAIHETNRNLSNLVSQSTNKNIEGFNALNAQLFNLHKTTDNVGQSIVDLMNQDIKIAENNKLLIQQQTTEITKSVNSLSETITNTNAQSSEQIVSAIGQASDKQADSLNQLGDSLGEKLDDLFDESTDGIIDAIGQASSGQIAATNQVSESIAGLSESIAGLEFGQPCDPNTDPRSCEGEHGLSTDYIERIYDETIQSATNIDDLVTAEYLEKIAEEANSERFQPLEKEGLALVGHFIDLLPASQPCDFDTLQLGKFTFQMTCDSVQFLKDILSFVFYLYTVYALMNILLDQVTPHGVPYMSRRM